MLCLRFSTLEPGNQAYQNKFKLIARIKLREVRGVRATRVVRVERASRSNTFCLYRKSTASECLVVRCEIIWGMER